MFFNKKKDQPENYLSENPFFEVIRPIPRKDEFKAIHNSLILAEESDNNGNTKLRDFYLNQIKVLIDTYVD